MLLTLAITLSVGSALLILLATSIAPAALAASSIAWMAQCWDGDRRLAVQYAFVAVLCLVAWILEVRHRSLETPRKT